MGLTSTLFLATLQVMGYPGGKSGEGVWQRLVNLIPPHQVYIEPFLGGGAVMLAKRPAALNIGVELDGEVFLRWHYRNLVESPQPAASAEAVTTGGASSRFQFLHGDGIRFLQSYPFTGTEMVYCDPPYLMETRSSGRLYAHEMTDDQHRELLATIVDLPCMVMISGYWSEMYADFFAATWCFGRRRWYSTSFQAMTRGGMATEYVWYNYPRPLALHDDRYLGADRREREQLKRKKARWTAALAAMPEVERQVLLCSLMSDRRGRERIKRKRERWTARINRMPLLERQALLAAIGSAAGNDGEGL